MTKLLCALGVHGKQVYVSYPHVTQVFCSRCGKLEKEIRKGGYYY